ncbi:TIGR03620 family F420-dependent LLM class oxidoreductase [Desertimonas flava]|uniref:TIGR03620 family F420-dependent LLM class oxidoreductase n=1 Tax=Desertimonas flava TaxID=2064846 RepID=UPI001968C0EC|nr:TIGR03620 family F420-dependent LLM class oxidoreductase [Desertimonas flava]
MNIGTVGVWQGGFGPPADVDRAFAAEVESLGYAAMWFGEAPGGKEAFTRATTLLASTSTLVIATGIASIWGRDPLTTASAIRTVSEAFPGRFVAGLGVSHAPAVEARGARYERPLSRLREYLAAMRGATLGSPDPDVAPTVVLAALGPRMLGLARDASDGAHPYFVTVEHVRRARSLLGPGKLLAPELAVVLEPDATEARRLARSHTGSFYLSAPNYVRALRWLGWDDDDLEGAGSDALVDALVAWGDEEAIAQRVREYLDAGADHVCIQPVTGIRPLLDGPDHAAIEVLRRLAPALTAFGDAESSGIRP